MPLLSLEEFRQILGYNPYHFWGLSNARLAPTSSCNGLIFEYGWQGVDAAGRQDILTAIDNAERMIAERLRYWPAPKYLESTLPWPLYHDRSVHRMQNTESDGRRVSVRLPFGKLRDVGYETRTTLGTYPVNVAKSEDCLEQSFTMDFATTETSTDNLVVEFASKDRFAGREDWEVRPLTLTISGGRCKVAGKLWLIVKPELYEEAELAENGNAALDPDDRNTFVDSLSIVKVTYTSGTTEPTAQAVLHWESRPCAGRYCCETSSLQGEPAASFYAVARAGVRNAEYGEVLPDLALYNSTAQTWELPTNWCCGTVEPDTVTVRYVSGVPRENRRMSRLYASAVARLAMAELSRRVCGCEDANRELYRWQLDMAAEGGEADLGFRLAEADLNSPLGTSRGAIWAWKQVKHLALRRGAAV